MADDVRIDYTAYQRPETLVDPLGLKTDPCQGASIPGVFWACGVGRWPLDFGFFGWSATAADFAPVDWPSEGFQRKTGPAPSVNKACTVQPATSFMQAHKADAATLATELQVPTDYVLAVAGNESAYGTSNIAIGANNYFGLHAGAPGSIGPWSGNPIVAAFAPTGGFMASGQSFVRIAAPLVRGLSSPINPTSFFTALHAKWGIGTPHYVPNMVQSAKQAQIRMNCPQ